MSQPATDAGRQTVAEEIANQAALHLDEAEDAGRANAGGVWGQRTAPDEDEELIKDMFAEAEEFEGERKEAQGMLAKEFIYPVCALTLWGALIGHLWIYEPAFGVRTLDPDLVPDEDKQAARELCVAMGMLLGLQLPGGILRMCATRTHPVLLRLNAQSMRGNFGHIAASILILMLSNVLIATSATPVFLEARTDRRVYPERFVMYTVTCPSMVIFNFSFLFKSDVTSWKCILAIVCSMWTMLFGLWGAISSTWALFWVFTLISWSWWLGSVLCYVIEMRSDKAADRYSIFGTVGVKWMIMFMLLAIWGWYGVWYQICYADIISQETEFQVWTVMDVFLKLLQVIVNIAWEESRWAMRNTFASYALMRREQQRRAVQDERRKKINDQASSAGGVGGGSQAGKSVGTSRVRFAGQEKAEFSNMDGMTGSQAPSDPGALPSFQPEAEEKAQQGPNRMGLIFNMIPKTNEDQTQKQ